MNNLTGISYSKVLFLITKMISFRNQDLMCGGNLRNALLIKNNIHKKYSCDNYNVL